jgi:hypothetical protein
MFDRLKVVFASLNSHDVKYVVIGGVAAIVHGSTRNTFDLDILIEATTDNAQRLLEALLAANFGTAALISADELLQNEITVFKDRVLIDVQTRTPGLTFETAWSRREIREAQGVTLHVVCRDDLIASKRAAGRPKDIADLEALESD